MAKALRDCFSGFCNLMPTQAGRLWQPRANLTGSLLAAHSGQLTVSLSPGPLRSPGPAVTAGGLCQANLFPSNLKFKFPWQGRRTSALPRLPGPAARPIAFLCQWSRRQRRRVRVRPNNSKSRSAGSHGGSAAADLAQWPGGGGGEPAAGEGGGGRPPPGSPARLGTGGTGCGQGQGPLLPVSQC